MITSSVCMQAGTTVYRSYGPTYRPYMQRTVVFSHRPQSNFLADLAAVSIVSRMSDEALATIFGISACAALLCYWLAPDYDDTVVVYEYPGQVEVVVTETFYQ